MKVRIATPFYYFPTIDYYYAMMTELSELRKAGMEVTTQGGTRDSVHRQRNRLAAYFLACNADVLVFVDSDTGFRGSDLVRMIKADLPIVCVNYPKTEYRFALNGDFKSEDQLRDAMLKPSIVTKRNAQQCNGMTEILYGGTGLMVIQRRVFTEIIKLGLVEKLEREVSPAALPYYYHFFSFPVTREGHALGKGIVLGEDYNFCDLARTAGFTVWCDPEAIASHTGLHSFAGNPRWPEPFVAPEEQQKGD